MFPALYTPATSCTQHGVRQSCAFTLHVGSGSVFVALQERSSISFQFHGYRQCAERGTRKDGWKHLEDPKQGSILCSSLPFFSCSHVSFSLLLLLSSSLGKSLDEHVFSYVALCWKLMQSPPSLLEALYPFLRYLFYFCRLLWYIACKQCKAQILTRCRALKELNELSDKSSSRITREEAAA